MPQGKGTYGSKVGRPPKQDERKEESIPTYDAGGRVEEYHMGGMVGESKFSNLWDLWEKARGKGRRAGQSQYEVEEAVPDELVVEPQPTDIGKLGPDEISNLDMTAEDRPVYQKGGEVGVESPSLSPNPKFAGSRKGGWSPYQHEDYGEVAYKKGGKVEAAKVPHEGTGKKKKLITIDKKESVKKREALEKATKKYEEKPKHKASYTKPKSKPGKYHGLSDYEIKVNKAELKKKAKKVGKKVLKTAKKVFKKVSEFERKQELRKNLKPQLLKINGKNLLLY